MDLKYLNFLCNNVITLCIIQYTSRNRPVKDPALGSTDKYATLFPLAWPIKPDFHLRIFSYEATFSWILIG